MTQNLVSWAGAIHFLAHPPKKWGKRPGTLRAYIIGHKMACPNCFECRSDKRIQ